jgi:hypothetical protein
MVYIPPEGESRREWHGAFIEANITQLARQAHQGYQQQGRGMLLLDESAVSPKTFGRFYYLQLSTLEKPAAVSAIFARRIPCVSPEKAAEGG